MKCFYHKSDLDGICSGAIVKYQYPECEMIGVDYSSYLEDITPIKFKANESVFIVDFCFDWNFMYNLNSNCCLVWIDHHKSAILNAYKKGFIARGGQSLEVGKAACELTWEYLFPEKSIIVDSYKEMPMSVFLLGRYDVWDNTDIEKWQEEVLPFQYGMRLRNYDVNSKEWSKIFEDEGIEVDTILDQGELILEYQKQQNINLCKSAFEIKFEGYNCICLNANGINSSAFDSVFIANKHDIMLSFCFKNKQWVVSLYSKKVDVSEIAKKYGGGGHKDASGFSVEDILKIIKD